MRQAEQATLATNVIESSLMLLKLSAKADDYQMKRRKGCKAIYDTEGLAITINDKRLAIQKDISICVKSSCIKYALTSTFSFLSEATREQSRPTQARRTNAEQQSPAKLCRILVTAH